MTLHAETTLTVGVPPSDGSHRPGCGTASAARRSATRCTDVSDAAGPAAPERNVGRGPDTADPLVPAPDSTSSTAQRSWHQDWTARLDALSRSGTSLRHGSLHS